MKRGPKHGAERKFNKQGGAPWRSEGGERRFGGGGRDFGGERRDFGGERRDFGGFDREGGDERPPRRTYRRDGGQQGGYGRPSFGRDRQFTPREPNQDFAASPKPFARGPQPVPARKLTDGVAQANKALAELIESFGKSIRGDYDISELEITCSFDNDGRFIGFGVGGAVSMTLTVTPLDAENVLAAGDDEDEDEEQDEDEDEGQDDAFIASMDDEGVDEEVDSAVGDDDEEEEILVKE